MRADKFYKDVGFWGLLIFTVIGLWVAIPIVLWQSEK